MKLNLCSRIWLQDNQPAPGLSAQVRLGLGPWHHVALSFGVIYEFACCSVWRCRRRRRFRGRRRRYHQLSGGGRGDYGVGPQHHPLLGPGLSGRLWQHKGNFKRLRVDFVIHRVQTGSPSHLCNHQGGKNQLNRGHFNCHIDLLQCIVWWTTILKTINESYFTCNWNFS